MSASDIDDKLGPKGELDKLKKGSESLSEYLEGMDELPIKRASIPFGAGISEDGKVRYVDHGLRTKIKNIDISRALATHESVEWALREFCGIGKDYAKDPRGHRLANRAEAEVVDELGLTWSEYDSFMDPQLKKVEHEKIKDVPRDLALYPYEDTPLYKKLLEATGRSRR